MHKLDSPSHTNKRTHAEGEGNTEVGRVVSCTLRLAVMSKADMIGFQVYNLTFVILKDLQSAHKQELWEKIYVFFRQSGDFIGTKSLCSSLDLSETVLHSALLKIKFFEPAEK